MGSAAGTGAYRYVRVSGDGQNSIEGSNSILGTWTNLGNLSSIGLTGHVLEGPAWMKFKDRNECALYIDYLNSNGVREYRPILTTNPYSAGSYRLQDPACYDMGGTAKRHGSIMSLTAAEEGRVLARWPNTAINRPLSITAAADGCPSRPPDRRGRGRISAGDPVRCESSKISR